MKSKNKLHHAKLSKQIGVMLLSFIFSLQSIASPILDSQNPINATVQQTALSNGNFNTTINQTADKAIINWQSFNIGANEVAHFQQPVGGIALNRINSSQGASQIYGQLTSTGQIILMNSAGIHFGPSSYVNVGGLIATTANLTDSQFLSGQYQFLNSGNYNGSIINEGHIIAANHGLVALVGSNVSNSGLIEANLGQVVLASGDAFTMNFAGDELINFSVDSQKSAGSITNSGSLIANGGKILISADASEKVLDHSINLSGIVEAKSVGIRHGQIIISGNRHSGTVRIAAHINASGKNAEHTGGNVNITGNTIYIDAPTSIDVSGDVGGGNINIGGNTHGAGLLPNANTTKMAAGSSLMADAISSGNGGNIVLWSDNTTEVQGIISAHGGTSVGNGGFIETSGKKILSLSNINIDLTAAQGQTGTWLLDPEDLIIQTNGPGTATAAGSPVSSYTSNVDTSILMVSTLQSALANASVVVQTGSGGSQAGNITLANALTWSSANNLTLRATHNIYLNSDITALNGGLTLAATNLSQSITSGSGLAPSSTGVTANINVKNFTLSSGQWYQNNASLPNFTISNNFTVMQAAAQLGSFLRTAGGDGSINTPYIINDVYGLQGLNTSQALLGVNANANYVLANDIDASTTSHWTNPLGNGFVPIGNDNDSSLNWIFRGTLDGQNHTISNLYINVNQPTELVRTGLFGDTFVDTLIQNLNLTGLNIAVDASRVVGGGLVGFGRGNINNVSIAGNMTLNNSVSFDLKIGGIVGVNFGAILKSSSNLNVNFNTTNNSYMLFGGIVGLNQGTVSESYSTGPIIFIANSNPAPFYVGGLVGENDTTINNSYSTSPITITTNGTPSVGGLVGINGGTISNSYSSGAPISNNGHIGGFIGDNNGTVTHSYWNTTTSQKSSGVYSGSSSGITGNSNAQMMQASNFASWNMSGIWNVFEGQTAPYLRNIFTGLSGTSTGPAGTSIGIASLGSFLTPYNSPIVAASGNFYLLIKNTNIIPGEAFNLYASSNISSNTIGLFPTSGSTISTLSLLPNTLQLSNTSVSTLSNSNLAAAIGNLSNSNFLYTASGNDIRLASGINLTSTANNSYNLNGNLNASQSTLTFNGTLSIPASATISNIAGISLATMTGTGTLNLSGDNASLTLPPESNSLNLSSAGMGNINSNVNFSGFFNFISRNGGGVINLPTQQTYVISSTEVYINNHLHSFTNFSSLSHTQSKDIINSVLAPVSSSAIMAVSSAFTPGNWYKSQQNVSDNIDNLVNELNVGVHDNTDEVIKIN